LAVSSLLLLCCVWRIPRPRRPPLFPYTTLFRSRGGPWLAAARARAPASSPSLVTPSPRQHWKGARPPRTRRGWGRKRRERRHRGDRKSTRLNSSHVKISYAVFCLKKKKTEQNER